MHTRVEQLQPCLGTGITTSTEVPEPGVLRIRSRPPCASADSTAEMEPEPDAATLTRPIGAIKGFGQALEVFG